MYTPHIDAHVGHLVGGFILLEFRVAQAVQQSNVNLPTGNFDGRHHSYTVEVNGQLTDAAQYRPVIVAYLIIIVLFFVIINLVVDIIYSLLDPRVRLGGQKS